MKCPLFGVRVVIGGKEPKHNWSDCIKEECAWWRKEYPACCIYSIERAMWAIAAELGTIMERMPHAD